MKFNCAYDELVEVHKLIPNPKNPNKHPPEQIERLAKIIDYQGQRSPVIVSNLSGFIVVGHGRLEAMQHLGYDKIAVNFQDFDNDAQEYAHVTADNAIAEWASLDLSMVNLDILDFGPELDLEMLGMRDFVVEPLDKLDPQCDEDDVPDAKDPITKRGDVWLLGEHRVMCGDSTMIDDVEKLMNGEKADMVFTSPPYSDMRDYNGEKDLSVARLAEFITCFKDYASMMVVNLGIQRKGGEIFPYWDDYINKAKSCGYKFSSWNIWNREGKGGSVGNMTAQFPIEHEWIFVFSEPNREINKTRDNVSSTNKKKVTNRNKDGTTTSKEVSVCKKGKIGTVSSFDFDRFIGKERSHPAQFPVLLADHYIEACSDKSVIDTFGGSGTTIISCEKNNRKNYSMELDEKYCDVIVNRWQNYTGKEATLESNGETYNSMVIQ